MVKINSWIGSGWRLPSIYTKRPCFFLKIKVTDEDLAKNLDSEMSHTDLGRELTQPNKISKIEKIFELIHMMTVIKTMVDIFMITMILNTYDNPLNAKLNADPKNLYFYNIILLCVEDI